MLLGQQTKVTEDIIRCAIEVHAHLGPGLLESVYEAALCVELQISTIRFSRQIGIPLYYKGTLISEHRPDLIVAEQVIVENQERRASRPSPCRATVDLSPGRWIENRTITEFQHRVVEARDQKGASLHSVPQ